MSSVRFVVPKQRLTELLRMPGGLPVVEALQRAQANLETIKPSCRAELLALLELAEASHANLEPKFDAAGLAELYSLAVRGVGAGAVSGSPGVDEGLTSLCDLLDALITQRVNDLDAIGVNLRAWRLLMTPDLPDAGAQAILQGLKKVSARYSGAA
ncbi:MAG: hypothetical protein ACHP9T_07020 [Caulobacterales bacterium]|jgi:hypothetical protein